MDGPEVGDRGGHHQDVRVGGVLGDGLVHLGRGGDPEYVHTGRIRQIGGVTGDQRDVGAALGGDPRDRVTLFPRAPIADEPHRVERLPGAAGRDQESPAVQVVGHRLGAAQQQPGERGDLLGLGKPPGTGVRAGEPTRRRLEHDCSTAAQRRHVARGGRVLPHLGVHGGREEHRAAGGQQRRGEQVVGAAGSGAGQQIRRRRSDHHQIGLLAEAHVRDLRNVVEHPGVNRMARQRLERGGADEAQRGLGGYDPDVVPGLAELAHHRAGLVGGDATGDADDDPLGVHDRQNPRPRGYSPSVCSSRSAWISRIAIDSGFSCGPGSTSGPTYSRMPVAELVVVVVDLAGALGGVDDQGVLAGAPGPAAHRWAGW